MEEKKYILEEKEQVTKEPEYKSVKEVEQSDPTKVLRILLGESDNGYD